jgi:hypothetical protein
MPAAEETACVEKSFQFTVASSKGRKALCDDDAFELVTDNW